MEDQKRKAIIMRRVVERLDTRIIMLVRLRDRLEGIATEMELVNDTSRTSD